VTATFDADALYVALDRKRRAQRLYWRDVAAEAGTSPSTFSRIAQLKKPDADTLVRLLLWLGATDVAPFIRREAQP
jgi:transcriptional regulator with XRE-family HTH domain